MAGEPSFEEALDSLEKIVEELEGGALSLEETLKKFEEGIKLSRFCEKKLKKAQKKVSLLMQNEEGELEEVPFEGPDEAEPPENRQTGTESLFDE